MEFLNPFQNDPLQTILNYTEVPCLIFWKDKNLAYQGGNATFFNLIGATNPEDFAGKSDFDFPWAKDAPLYRASDLLSLEGKPFLAQELRWRNNGYRQVVVHKLPIKNTKNEIIGILGIQQDITEIVTLSNEIQTPPSTILQKTEIDAKICFLLKSMSNTLLTRREIECLSLWLSGYSIKESAYCLNLSHKSIEAYRKNVKDKMGVHHRFQLIEIMQTKNTFHVFMTLAKLIQQQSQTIRKTQNCRRAMAS